MMKFCVILFVLINSLLASSVENSASSSIEDVASSSIENLTFENLEDVEFAVSKELEEKLLAAVQGGGSVTSVIDEYADEILKNVAELIISNGFDPVELPNATLNLIPTGHIFMTEGWLQDLSTISRFENVTSTYKSSERLLIVALPLKFDALLFTYKYHTEVLLLNLRGDVNGKLEKVKMRITLQFDFNTYKAELSQFDMSDTGKLSVEFSGLGLIDWVTNSMTSVVSLFLHPIIIAIINSIVKAPLKAIVEAVNEIIVCILTPAECNNSYF
ncbi:unnamed protein product [Phaedon cochleariae]|uniref:Uncharacterized protein n=1 Tax=Phaedon cochleariae TaxID=80249 RepID=A0A9P0DH41_PHACE|nr:unnamed protein product [Phaedon cochleariae]